MTLSHELVQRLLNSSWPITVVVDLSDDELIALFHTPTHHFPVEQWKQWDVVQYAVLVESRSRFEKMVQK